MLISASLDWKWVSSMAAPKLRFKDSEGREFPKLKNGKMGDVIVELKETIDPEDSPEKLYIEYSMPAFDNGKLPDSVYGKNMHSIRKVITEPCVLVNKLNVRKQRIWLHNEFEEDAVCSTEFVALASNGLCSLEYINQLALTERFTVYLLSNSSGTSNSQQRVSPVTILNYGFHLPSLPEQQKIADFLTAYDTMIDTQTKRVEAMKVRKKGLLQKIFSQEIRFKNEQGQVYPEWIVQKLEELVSMHARIGWQNLRTSEFLNSGDYYLVTGTDFVNGKIDFSTCHYIGKERFEQDKKIQLDNDNILITKDGTLGKVAYVDILPKPTTLNAGIFCLKSKKQNINMKYLFQYLRGPFMMQYCNRHSTGGTIKHLNQGVLITFPVPLPSLSEQQKIADFLTAVDHQIEVEENRLERMQVIKKGLLQQMFI